MPFTFAHPAAVLPFLRRAWAVPAALVIGAMVPDAEYFVWLRAERTLGHDPLGVLLFDLPAGLALWALWERLWRAHALALWPALARCLGRPGTSGLPGGLRALPRVVASLALGAASHLLWDAATHERGGLVARLPALQATAFTLPGDAVAWYRVLQHGSTLLGFALLVGYTFRRGRASGATPAGPDLRALAGLVSVAAAASCTALARTPRPHARVDLVHALLAGLSAFIVAFTVQALWRRRLAKT